jgi:hypothetical protein
VSQLNRRDAIMVYRGRVRNGVVVFEGPPPVEDGTLVHIEPIVSEPTPRPGSRDALLACRARWVGPAGELDRLLAEVQAMRDADLTPAGGEE